MILFGAIGAALAAAALVLALRPLLFMKKAAQLSRWEKMLPLVPADSEDARSIQASVDEARALIGKKDLKGVVKLSPKLAGKVSPEDPVFIFARAAEGPPMPLAVLRKQARDLPGSSAPVANDAEDVNVVIDSVVP